MWEKCLARYKNRLYQEEYYKQNRERIAARDRKRRETVERTPEEVEKRRLQKLQANLTYRARYPEKVLQQAKDFRRRHGQRLKLEDKARRNAKKALRPPKPPRAKKPPKPKALVRYPRNKKWESPGEAAYFNTLKKLFGIDKDTYEKMVVQQDRRCGICQETPKFNTPKGRQKRLAVDHCHKSGKIRGLLCGRCNPFLGFMDDSVISIIRMIDYVEFGGSPSRFAKISTPERLLVKGIPKEIQFRARNLHQKYGLSLSGFDAILSEQNGVCAICRRLQCNKRKNLDVDHCHRTGELRGLLCSNCNTGLGLMKDSVPLLQSAVVYLNSHNNL